MTARAELRLVGQLDPLRIAWQVGETLLNEVPFEDESRVTRYTILLAMQELLTNVFRHGYRASGEQPVDVRFESSEHAFEFEIRDRAPRFDPTTGQESRDDERMPDGEGGYGLVIANTVMDVLEYRFENGWNIIRATKMVAASVAVGAPEEPS